MNAYADTMVQITQPNDITADYNLSHYDGGYFISDKRLHTSLWVHCMF